MKFLKEQRSWVGATVVCVSLIVAAVGVAQRQSNNAAVTAHDAKELSRVFRKVSDSALPSIVSIVARGKAPEISKNMQNPFGDKSPFGDLFQNDPRFRDFFENQRRFRRSPTRAKGSGFIIDPSGIILTNSHVVRDAEEVVVKLFDGREIVASVIGTDPRSDVAVIKIETEGDLQAVPLGDSQAMQIGDWVLAVGSPFGFDLSVTAGIISGKGRGPGINVSEDYLQTDAAINPGNSGGPLLNLQGEVIGINTAISTRSGGYDGIGFAIPSNMATWVADQLTEKGKVQRAFLGVSIQPTIPRGLAKRLGIPLGQGALVTAVVPDSAAAKADLKPGDLILKLDGNVVHGLRGLRVITEKLEFGKSYDMLIIRDGERMTVSFTAEEMTENIAQLVPEDSDADSETPQDEPGEFDDLGIETQQLTPRLAQRLGLKDVKGVVVTAVEPNSPAERAELQAGHVIQKVGTTKITSVDEFRAALDAESSENGILLLVRSQAGARFIVIETP